METALIIISVWVIIVAAVFCALIYMAGKAMHEAAHGPEPEKKERPLAKLDVIVAIDNFYMTGLDGRRFLTHGRWYTVIFADEYGFCITDDEGDRHEFSHKVWKKYFIRY